jgi:prepilin-type N-terminal cleavage/methylation domain-containing protein
VRRVKGIERRVKSQQCGSALCSASGSRPSTLDSRLGRRGLTLVELLVTIMIIGILAAMVLGVAAVAGNTAREAKTRSMVNRLHTLLMEQVDTYKSRRVKVRQAEIDAINDNSSLSAAEKGRRVAEARLYALREMMLLEMPDRWSDVLLNSLPTNPSASVPLNPVYLDASGSSGNALRTELSSIYLRRLGQIAGSSNSLTGQANTDKDLIANQGAECLYMVITLACGDGEARSLFHENDIGDTDGDGAPEFLDGWGHPISFLRWAPGFDSEIQLNANLLGNPPTSFTDTANETWLQAANGDHDPFDIYRRDPAAFRLVPLIYSAGRDEEYGIYTADDSSAPIWTGISNLNMVFDPSSNQLSPYKQITEGSVTEYLGTDLNIVDGTKTATDNIHNHLIGKR